MDFSWETLSCLTADMVQRVSGKCASLCKLSCWSVKTWPIYGIFFNSKIYLPIQLGGSMRVTKPNFMLNGQTFAEIWQFLIFSKWRPSTVLDLLYACVDAPQTTFDVLSHCAKFGWIWCSIVDNTQVLIFRMLGLKMPFHTLKIGILQDFTSKMGSSIKSTPRIHFLALKHIIWL